MVDRRQKRRFVVYQIKNTKNLAKVLVESTPNLKTINGKLMLLRGGGQNTASGRLEE